MPYSISGHERTTEQPPALQPDTNSIIRPESREKEHSEGTGREHSEREADPSRAPIPFSNIPAGDQKKNPKKKRTILKEKDNAEQHRKKICRLIYRENKLTDNNQDKTNKRKFPDFVATQLNLDEFFYIEQGKSDQVGSKKKKLTTGTKQDRIDHFFDIQNRKSVQIAATPTSTQLFLEKRGAQDRGFHIMTVNAQSSLIQKMDTILNEMHWNDIDVAVITETGLREDNYRHPRITDRCAAYHRTMISTPFFDGKAGHLIVIHRDNLSVTKQTLYKEGRMISLSIDVGPELLHIMAVYQGFDANKNIKIRKEISTFVKQYKTNCIVLGDLNEVASVLDHTANYTQKDRAKGPLHAKLERIGMKDSLRTFSNNLEHTFVKTNSKGKCFTRLDYIYISNDLTETLLSHQVIYGSHISSDHMPVWIALQLSPVQVARTDTNYRINTKGVKSKKWELWREKCGLELKRLNGNPDPCTWWTKTLVKNAQSLLHSNKMVIKTAYQWAIQDDLQLHDLRQQERSLRHAFNTKLSTDQTNLKLVQKEIKNQISKIGNKVRDKEWLKLGARIRSEPGYIFKMLRKTGKKAGRVNDKPLAVLYNGTITTNPKIVMETFQREWATVFTSKSEAKPLPKWLKDIQRNPLESPILDVEFTKQDIQEAIAKLKSGKAEGPDRISNEMLKQLDEVSIETLRDIMETVRQSKLLPEEWKTANTVLLYKGSGDKTNPMNFRPIALLSCAYKIYSRIITTRLTAWIEKEKIIHESQYGFQKGKDTADAAASLFACLREAIKNNRELHMILLDFAKAYDSVEFWALRQTLECYGLHQNDIQLLMAGLVGNSTCLETAHGFTERITCTAGFKQGDLISPILYLIFLNPLLTWLERNKAPFRIGTDASNSGAYADDLTLIAKSGTGIKEAMNKVNQFAEHNCVSINTSKSTYHWRGGEPADIKTRGVELRKEGEKGYFTLLGWTTNLCLDWNAQVESSIAKYTTTVNCALSERKLTINQKVQVINAIATTAVLYRTKLFIYKGNSWLQELDKWTIKKLNKIARVDPNSHAAYWWKFRGLTNLKIEAEAAYIGQTMDRTLNDNTLKEGVKNSIYEQFKLDAKQLHIDIMDNRTDLINKLDLDQKTINTLKKYKIERISQLTKNGTAMTPSYIDKVNMDAPGRGRSYDRWTFKLSKTVQEHVRRTQETSYPAVKLSKWTAFTDGSKTGNKAGVGSCVQHFPEANISTRASGDQEINNAELQAVLFTLYQADNRDIHIYSDSLNTVRFCQKGETTSQRQILHQPNARVKIALKEAIHERKAKGWSTDISHVRSHAQDKKCTTREIRHQQNKERFGERAEDIEEGNSKADVLAGLGTKKQRTKQVLFPKTDFSIRFRHKIIDCNSRQQFKSLRYDELIKSWHKSQPVRSAFNSPSCDPISLPTRNEPWANLSQKIMTGTIWTNKLRNRLDATHTADCDFCSELTGISVVDSHQHVLGDCALTIEAKDRLWDTIQQLWKRHNLNSAGITPWFHTSSTRNHDWQLPSELGDKGLLPRTLRRRLTKMNKGKNISKIIFQTSRVVKKSIIDMYMERHALNYS